MDWPEHADSPLDGGAPHLWVDPSGRLGVSSDAVSQADDRFEAICAELGILLARRVEPVSARVLPFGTEQLAMVELREETTGAAQLHTATARGASPAAAVAGAAINAVTGGRNVLAAALPGAVAEGKVRSAVVFGDGEAPVRWGLAEDEGRLAALYAVVPHLGSFTATTGADTYRVLRFPGIGVALVSEGASAAAWVEGWFAALLHATQFALRTEAPSTSMVATTTPPAPAADDPAARMLLQLEEQCRRILTAAQEQALEIREAALRDTAPAGGSSPGDAAAAAVPDADDGRESARVAGALGAAEARAESLEAQLASTELALQQATDDLAAERVRADAAAAALVVERERLQAATSRSSELERGRRSLDDRRDDELARRELDHLRLRLQGDVRSESELLLRDAERTRATVLDDARRQADQMLRDADRTSRELLGEARREAERLLRDAERTRSTILDAATRESQDVLRDAERARREVEQVSRREQAAARAEADDLRSAAREDADRVVRDARRLAGELAARVEVASGPPASPVTASPVTASTDAPASPSDDGPVVDGASVAVSLLGAVAESLRAMSAVVARGDGDAPSDSTPTGGAGTGAEDTAHALSDLPGLFFGA